jgi:hypothetical protein
LQGDEQHQGADGRAQRQDDEPAAEDGEVQYDHAAVGLCHELLPRHPAILAAGQVIMEEGESVARD